MPGHSGPVDQIPCVTLTRQWTMRSVGPVTVTIWHISHSWLLLLQPSLQKLFIVSGNGLTDIWHCAIGHFESIPIANFPQLMIWRKARFDNLEENFANWSLDILRVRTIRPSDVPPLLFVVVSLRLLLLW